MKNRTTAVGELAAQKPGSIQVFEDLGIDYSCRGRRSLADACDAAGVLVDDVLNRLRDHDEVSEASWQERTARELIHHLVSEHHSSAKTSIVHLRRDITKLRAKPAAECPNLAQIELIVHRLSDLLAHHMAGEEMQMFPYIAKLEAALESGAEPPIASDSLANRVLVEYIEHDQLAERFSKLRELTGSYRAPEGACREYACVMVDLRRFDRAVQRHMHLENNILLPRAVELENELKHRLVHS